MKMQGTFEPNAFSFDKSGKALGGPDKGFSDKGGIHAIKAEKALASEGAAFQANDFSFSKCKEKL